MKRTELKNIIAQAADEAGCRNPDKRRLVASADNINAVAYGSFVGYVNAEECGCPATVAGYAIPNIDREIQWSADADDAVREFPGKFDPLMATAAALSGGGKYVGIDAVSVTD